MRKVSLAEAKSQLSVLVDAAEHQHQKIIILRHGKAAAAIVPVSLMMRNKPQELGDLDRQTTGELPLVPGKRVAYLPDRVSRRHPAKSETKTLTSRCNSG
jgi:prevent-host-death family protein